MKPYAVMDAANRKLGIGLGKWRFLFCMTLRRRAVLLLAALPPAARHVASGAAAPAGFCCFWRPGTHVQTADDSAVSENPFCASTQTEHPLSALVEQHSSAAIASLTSRRARHARVVSEAVRDE